MIYIKLIWAFIKIGAFTFGGGYAMIPPVQAAAEKYGWMSSEELMNVFAISQSAPGPLAVNMATYIGSEVAGLPGALAAAFGVMLPSFFIVLLVAKMYSAFSKNKYVAGCMSGLKPAVVGLIAAALFSTVKTVFFPEAAGLSALLDAAFYVSAGILAFDIFLVFKKVHPIVIILISAVLGIAVGYADKLLF